MSEISLNYKSMGSGEPVIILHGFLGMLDNWKTFGRALSEEFEVFLLDQRDHGKSPHTEAFSYEILAEDLLHFMDEQKITKAHLIGHSMGGKTVMQFAQAYPDRVNKAIIVDISPKENPNHHSDILDALHSFNPTYVNDRSEAEQKLEPKIPDWGVRQFLMKNLSRNKEGGFRWKMNLELLTKNYDEILKFVGNQVSQIECLFVAGGRSNYISSVDHPIIKEYFPKAKIETIEDAGHWVHAEKPKELLAIVRHFLESHDAA